MEDPKLKGWLVRDVLLSYLKDRCKARLLLPDGTYQRLRPVQDEPAFNVQDWFLRPGSEAPVPPPPELTAEASVGTWPQD